MKKEFILPDVDNSSFAALEPLKNGGFDDIRIQAAVDRLGSAGGTIYLRRGVYCLSAPVRLRSGVVLEGEGDATRLRLANSSRIRGHLTGKEEAKVTVENTAPFRIGTEILLVSNKVYAVYRVEGIQGRDLRLNEPPAKNFGLHAKLTVTEFRPMIVVAEADNVTIRCVALDGNRAGQLPIPANAHAGHPYSIHPENNPAILIDNSRKVTIAKCRIFDTQASAIQAFHSVGGLEIIDNHIENTGDKGIVTCWSEGPGLIAGNRIEHTGVNEKRHKAYGFGDAINIHPPSGREWIIRDNLLRYAKRSGIRITGASDSIVQDNIITDCLGTGIECRNSDRGNIIIRNTIRRVRRGITSGFDDPAEGGGHAPPFSMIAENIILESREYGIALCASSYWIEQRNLISATGSHAILVTDSSWLFSWKDDGSDGFLFERDDGSCRPHHLLIGDNTVTGSRADGVYLHGSIGENVNADGKLVSSSGGKE